MSLHRFFAPPRETTGACIRLSGPEAHHASRVLRIRRGDAAQVLNGDGARFSCRVADSTNHELTLDVLEKSQEPPPSCRIRLFQAIPKGKILESIIQKATELGVAEIVPVLTDHVVARPDEREFDKKEQKWQAIAIEAVKQCGQPWLPRVAAPLGLREALALEPRAELGLAGALSGEPKHPREWFDEFAQKAGRKPRSISLWIGPEGDFTKEELDSIIASGVRPVKLGPLVLRCETAAIYLLSVARYETTA